MSESWAGRLGRSPVNRVRGLSARRRGEEWDARIRELSDRVDRLEAELAESRRLSLRLAELTDVVQELLVPLADRDSARVRDVLEKYVDELGS